MDPIIYSICQKPVIGMVMWLTSLCVFPPLFSDEPIELSVKDSSTTKIFKVPVDKKYQLTVSFEFESIQKRLEDQIVGKTGDCSNVIYEEISESSRKDYGRPIPFKVVVRRADDRAIVLDKEFVSLCVAYHDLKTIKGRTIGWIELPRGKYVAEVTNLVAQSGLKNTKTKVSLGAGHGK